MGNWTGGEKVRIWFGDPIDLSDFYTRGDSVRTHKEIADHLMEQIAQLGREDKQWVEQQGSDEGTVL